MNTLHPTKKSNNAQRGSHTTRPPARATNIRDYRTHRYREHSGSLLTCGRPGRGAIRDGLHVPCERMSCYARPGRSQQRDSTGTLCAG